MSKYLSIVQSDGENFNQLFNADAIISLEYGLLMEDFCTTIIIQGGVKVYVKNKPKDIIDKLSEIENEDIIFLEEHKFGDFDITGVTSNFR